ncbi:MAG TPA: hypothetical protein VGG76_04695 [Gemmatimonadaceae bacterium]
MRYAVLTIAAGLGLARGALAQVSYRNLDAGFPVRVEDATPTERYALDMDFLNFRYDELSDLRNRFQYEPRVSYGILPRTEMWIRLPVYYRERTVTPRSGVAGVGVGGMYELKLESLNLPALAVESEVFKPTGPSALPTSYSVKALLTRSFAPGRIHLNASIATYALRVGPSLIVSCGKAAPGSTCDGGQPLPPIDGPCDVASSDALHASFMCAAPQPASLVSAQQALPGQVQTHDHWFLGGGIDKAFPLSSTVVVADFFAEKFEGIGRKTDLTSEVGVRHQLTPQVVIGGALGRHFRGAGFSTFLVAGLTYTRALQP